MFMLYGTEEKTSTFNFIKYFKIYIYTNFLFRFIYNHQIIQFKRKLSLVLYVHGSN